MSEDLPLVTIGRDGLRAVFAPTRGGRLLALSLHGEELLWQNPALVDTSLQPVVPVAAWPRGDGGMSTWANVGGSKTWPAPQGWTDDDEWHGPPDPVLDAGPWAVTAHAPHHVALRSAVDPTTGLQVERSFTVEERGRLTERVTFTNVGAATTRWAPWEVCQVRTDDGGVVLVEGASAADEVDLGAWEGRVRSTTTPRGVEIPVGAGVAKHGFRAAGAVSYRRASGTTLRLHVVAEGDVVAAEGAVAAPFPDGGCLVEVWSQRPVAAPITELGGLRPDAHLAELEVLGRREPLASGASRTVTIAWDVLGA